MGKGKNNLGSWAFLIGVAAAVILGIFVQSGLNQTMIWVFVAIGLIVGFLNVTGSETQPFLLSGAVLIITSAWGSGGLYSIPVLKNILSALLTIFVPATIIVAIKNVFDLAKN